MRLEVEHAFAFEYDGYISESFLELRVQPRTTPTQTVLAFGLAVGPRTRVYRYVDWNDNVTHHFTITRFHDRIEVRASLADGAPLGEQVLTMGRALREQFEYRKDVTRYDSTSEDFLELGKGVCQDFAHLMLGWLRLSGIPCRYVSGYLHVDRKKREPSQSHAWVELYSATAGWVPFDPTHNRAVDERYVVVGHGRHYDDVPPNKGIYRGVARETLKAEVVTEVVPGKTVSTLREDFRHIDLPVFREVPARPPDRAVSAVDDMSAQQQQQ